MLNDYYNILTSVVNFLGFLAASCISTNYTTVRSVRTLLPFQIEKPLKYLIRLPVPVVRYDWVLS